MIQNKIYIVKDESPMKNAYLQKVYADVLARDPGALEFHQCIREFLESLECIVDKHPEWEENGILERFVEPDRVITFPSFAA